MLNTSASSIKYVANKESVTNKVFVANQVLSAIMSLSERSADNILAQANQVFIRKINYQYFGITYLKDQRTLIWLGPVKYLFERSIDNTSARANQAFI